MTTAAALPAPIRRPLRLGVIGVGGIWKDAHLPALRTLRAAGWPLELAGVCDRDAARAAEAAAAVPGARVAGDLAGLIALGIDALVVLLPSNVTAEVVVAAAPQIGAILAEKPVADAVEPILAAAAVAERAGCRVQVAFNRPHQALAPRWRALADEQRAGHIAARFWRVRRDEPGFYDDVLGHPLSLLASLGPLAIDDVRVDRRPGVALPAGALVLGRAGARSFALDLRPATGRMLEEYIAVGDRASARLVFQFGHVAADPAGLWRLSGGGVEALGETDARSDHVTMAGFTHQLAAFARLASGEDAAPSCSLRDAAALQIAIRAAMARISAAGESAPAHG